MQVIASWGGTANKAWLIQRALHEPPDAGPRSKQVDWWSIETAAALRSVAASLDDSDA